MTIQIVWQDMYVIAQIIDNSDIYQMHVLYLYKLYLYMHWFMWVGLQQHAASRLTLELSSQLLEMPSDN